MTGRKLWMLCLCFLVPMLLQAQGDRIPLNSKIRTGQLPNGLKYFIVQNKKPEKKIELRLAVNAGAILEDEDQLGLAHLMEHMNFNGLEHFRGNEVVHYLQSIGVDFGADLNAYTGFDETVYILPIPADDPKKVDQGFQIIADWSHGALLEGEEIDKERSVVLEESRLGKGADDRMMKVWLPEFMNGSRYAKRLPIGDDELLKKFPHEVLRRFHRDWYRPNLQAVMVVGDIDPLEAEKLILQKFSQYKNPDKPRTRQEKFEIPKRTGGKAMVVTDSETPYTTIQIIGNNFETRSATTSAEYMDDIAERLFNSMLSARLNELKNAPNPPYIFAAAGFQGGWARNYEGFQTFAISGVDKVKEAVKGMIGEIMKVKQFGFSAEELERARQEVMADYEKSYNERDKTESSALVNELVRHFLTNEPVPGIEWEYNLVKSQIGSINLDKINRLRDKIDIDKNYFALVTTKTEKDVITTTALKSFVDEALKAKVEQHKEKELPKSLLVKAPTPGKVVNEVKNTAAGTVTWTLSNGARVTYKKTDYKNDEILFTAYRFGGSSTYTGKDFQSADYSNNVVDEMGYGLFSNSDLEKYMKGKTASVDCIVDINNDLINGRSSVKDFETAMQLLYLKCTQPRTDKESFKTFKDKQMQMLAQMKSDPSSFYQDSLNRFMYSNHPRSKEIPDASDFQAINLENAVNFYHQRFHTASGMNYFFVGSIPDGNFKQLVETYIGGLAGGDVQAMYKDLGMEPIKGEHTVVIRKGKEDKAMVNEMTYLYTPYDAKDDLALKVLNEVVNNKITDVIREEMSAIYGGGVGFKLDKFPKEKFSMQTYLPCGSENAPKVKDAFWKIMKGTQAANGITADELNKSVQTLLQKVKVGAKTNGYWLGNLAKMDRYKMPYDEILNAETNLSKVTAEDLMKVSKKYFLTRNIIHAMMMPEK